MWNALDSDFPEQLGQVGFQIRLWGEGTLRSVPETLHAWAFHPFRAGPSMVTGAR